MQPGSLITDVLDQKARGFRANTRARRNVSRLVLLGCLCIAIFDAAHLVYRMNHAPDWLDVRLLMASGSGDQLVPPIALEETPVEVLTAANPGVDS